MGASQNRTSRRPHDIAQLFARYAGRRHPLEYRGRYQLLVMVVLSARTTDKNVNALVPELFRKYPSLASLAAAQPEDLYPFIRKVTGFARKASWLVAIARAVGSDAAIPVTADALTKLPGLGRKSANVIVSESGGTMTGVIVDIHVLRVAPRIGIVKGSRPDMVEKELMRTFPQEQWRELGMSLTFLGRELCRPTDPNCPLCPLRRSCLYAKKEKVSAPKPKRGFRRPAGIPD
jgi:endonuclease-3